MYHSKLVCMFSMKRNGGVIMPNGIGFYCVFLTDQHDHTLEYFQQFLAQLMPSKIDLFFKDDSYYKKT